MTDGPRPRLWGIRAYAFGGDENETPRPAGRPAGAFSTVSRDDDYCGLLMSSFFMSSFLVVSFLLDLLFLAFFSVLSPLSAFLSIVLSLLPASWASAKEDIERVRATANSSVSSFFI